MTVSAVVRQKVAEWRPGGGRHTLHLPAGEAGWSAAITADRCEELGCLLWEVSLQAAGKRPGVTLEGWARQTAGRTRGLLETLKVLEVDPGRGEAVLRSDPPAARGDRVAYYEALLEGTTRATFRRYEAPRDGGRREQVPFALTQEALVKLVGDLAGE